MHGATRSAFCPAAASHHAWVCCAFALLSVSTPTNVLLPVALHPPQQTALQGNTRTKWRKQHPAKVACECCQRWGRSRAGAGVGMFAELLRRDACSGLGLWCAAACQCATSLHLNLPPLRSDRSLALYFFSFIQFITVHDTVHHTLRHHPLPPFAIL